MVMRVVQKGSGDTRPVVLCYYVDGRLDAKVRAAVSPQTCVLNQTFPVAEGKISTGGKYATFGSLRPLPEVLCTWNEKVGAVNFHPVVLLGFSEGCQGIRTQLRAGNQPSAIIAIDGIHSGMKPQSWSITPYRNYFELCGAELDAERDAPWPQEGKPAAFASYSQIRTDLGKPYAYASVKMTLERITGWSLPVVEAGESYQRTSGNLTIVGGPGGDAAAHILQAREVLPFGLRWIATQLGFGAPDPVASEAATSAKRAPVPIGPTCPTAAGRGTTEPPKIHQPIVLRRFVPAFAWTALAGLLGYTFGVFD